MGVRAVQQAFSVGAASLTVLNIGDLKFSLKDTIAVPESTWRPRYGDLFDRKLKFPSQSVLITVGETNILVDVGEYWKFAVAGSEYVDEGYAPPPGLTGQLAGMKLAAEQIGHVVITHAHYDHFAGVTTNRGGVAVPTFPRARHYLGRADWEWQELQSALADESSNESATLGVLRQRGALELVSGETEIAPGITIVPSPGESPGHQILRVRSQGHTAYCVGDLFHHAVEVENPEWMAPWCDPGTNLLSRQKLIEEALRENALLIPTHVMPGHLERSGGLTKYVENP